MPRLFLVLFLTIHTALPEKDPGKRPRYPSILKEIIEANLPGTACLKVEETSLHPMNGEYNAEFLLYIEGNGRTFAIEYINALSNPAKSVVFLNYGTNIWTLDSAGGQVRKIAYYKKTEPINGTPLTYWDIFPLLLVQRPYKITADKSISPTVRVVQLKPEKRFKFKRIQFQIEKKSHLLKKINLFSYDGSLWKEIRFQRTRENEDKLFPFRIIEIKNNFKNTFTTLKITKVQTEIKIPRKILNIPHTRYKPGG